MAYKYRISYTTAAHDAYPSELVHVDIYNPAETDHLLIELEGAEDVLTTGAENSGEDKFTPIRGQKATVQFNSTDTVNLLTFMSGDDNSWLVDAYVVRTNARIFKGFVLQDEISEAFMPNPNVVSLTATDGLGILKGEPLTDSDGNVPGGHYTLIQYISWCLEKTGLELPIQVINNIKEESDQTKIFYRTCYEWAKSFEAEVGTRIDCYRVLEHILGENCYLTQYNGEWWIVRIDELGQDAVTVNKFTYDGTFVEEYSLNTDQFIGTGRAMYWVNEDATVKPERAHKSVTETYNYEYPSELINNINYERGALISTDTIVGEDEYDEERRYAISDFITYRRYSDKSSQGLAEIDDYIVRRFLNGYEKDRFIEITPPTSSASPWHHIETIEGTPMMAKDKFTFSVDFRFTNDITGTGGVTFDLGHIRLEGVDGSIWTADQNGFWHESPQHRELGTAWAREDEKETDWQSYSITVKPLPVDGDVYFALYSGQLTAADGGFQTVHYANIDLEYIPYINGGYREYRGQYHKISQDIVSKAVRDEEVGMSDSPRPLFKGALKVYNGTKYVLAGRFYSSYHVDPPSDEHLHPYGHLQAFDVWNQHNRLMRVFEGTIQGLQVDGTLPGLIHKYRLTDITSHTVNKYFILLHGEFDWYKCEWRGTLVEVFDTMNPKVYDDTHEFKYLEE